MWYIESTAFYSGKLLGDFREQQHGYTDLHEPENTTRNQQESRPISLIDAALSIRDAFCSSQDSEGYLLENRAGI